MHRVILKVVLISFDSYCSKKKPKDLSALSALIFCEGKTDSAYIQKAISLFNPSLNQSLIKFVPLDGSNNLKKVLDTYKNQETTPTLETPCLFVFDWVLKQKLKKTL